MAAAADHRAEEEEEVDDVEEEGSEEEEVESGDEEEEEEDDDEAASLADICAPDAGSDEDPTFDPAADGDLEVEAVLRSRMARMSISARKGRKGSRMPEMGKEEMGLLSMVDKLMQDGQLEKLKVYDCKAYLRMHKLRLSGNKEVLLSLIREHIEKKGAPRGVKGHLCGQRTNAGRIIKESYGTKKQQHTFTIEILWSKGHKPWPPLHPLLIKGRNLCKDKTMRQPWPDEAERNRVLQEKHARGYVARKTREVRIKEKENRRMKRLNRNKENKSKGHDKMNKMTSQESLPQQMVIMSKRQQNMSNKSSQEVLPLQTVTMNTVQQRSNEKTIPSAQHDEPGNIWQQQMSPKQIPAEQYFDYHCLFPCPQQHNEELQKGTSRTSAAQLINREAPLQRDVKAETLHQLPESSKATLIQQSSAYPQQYPKHQHQNEVLPQAGPPQVQRTAVSQTTDVRQDFINQQGIPSKLYGGSENMRQQPISSRPTTTPQQAVKYTQQPPNHQYKNEVFWQQAGTDHDKQASQPRRTFTQKAKTYQHGSNGHHQALIDQLESPRNQDYYWGEESYEEDCSDHGKLNQGKYFSEQNVDHIPHRPLTPRNKDYYWGEESYGQGYNGDGKMDQGQYDFQQRHHGRRQMSQYQYDHRQNNYQNSHGNWGMNGNQYHDEQNHNQTYNDHGQMNRNQSQSPQRFQPWQPCHSYQQQGWCKYGENCKFLHEPNQSPRQFQPWKPCHSFQQQGWCKYGENCKFLHEPDQNPRRFQPWQPCHNYRQGWCKYGDNCKFLHE
uniref:C3H1-type domain-containing protein n=1 Tax=Leersia perrieri TaxID=77586 RepID=A0A0D9XJ98_9ORYZ